MLINIDSIKQRYSKMTTAELMALAGNKALSETELTLLHQELDSRADVIAPYEPGEKTTSTAPAKRHFVPPSPHHKWINLFAVLLALPLLKIIGYNLWWTMLITAIVAWLLSSAVIRLAGRLWGVGGIRTLPLLYFGAYYGLYSLLHRWFY